MSHEFLDLKEENKILVLIAFLDMLFEVWEDDTFD